MIRLHPNTVYNCILPVSLNDIDIDGYAYVSFTLASSTHIDVNTDSIFKAYDVLPYAKKVIKEMRSYTVRYIYDGNGMFLQDESGQLLWLQVDPNDTSNTYTYKNIRWNDELEQLYYRIN